VSANSRLTVAFHIMSLLARRQRKSDEWFASDQIADSVNTNAVFIRRILGMLKKAALVQVKHGGTNAGWKLSREAGDIRLLEVFNAVESKPLFDMHHSVPNPVCPIATGIQPALHGIYQDVQYAVKQEFAKKTVADLLDLTLEKNEIGR
jgi:Rrf2 family protein